MSRASKKIKMCAICGATNIPGSRDHLPPRSIFMKPRPQNLITVPSCVPCNNLGSKHDEVFKTFLAFLLGQTPMTEPLFKSAISTARKKFSQYILNNAKFVNLKTPSGIIYDQKYVFPLKPEIADPMEEVIKRMTTGLYYHHFKHFIGDNITFQVRYHNVLKKEMLQGVAYAVNRIGEGHFTYCYAIGVEGTKIMSLWVYEFYQGYWISCGALFDREKPLS